VAVTASRWRPPAEPHIQLITAERLLAWHTPAVYSVATTLAVLVIWLAVAPGDLAPRRCTLRCRNPS
jgi:hypothetical protein